MSRAAVAVAALVAFIAFALCGCGHATLSSAERARIDAAVTSDRAAFPELDGKRITIAPLESDDVFFQSSFTPASFAPLSLAYELDVNPRAFAAGLDDGALAGVLGHELAHTLDYASRPTLGLVRLLYPALFPSWSTWERRTDLVAIARGFGPQLLRYRTWLFRVMPRDVVEEKRAVYYAPLEIALLLDVQRRCPARFRAFLDAPPRDARGIAGDCP